MSKVSLTAGRPSSKKTAMQLMSDEVQLIRVTAELPADLQLRLKMHCLNTRQTMSQYLRYLLDESLPR